MGVAAAITSQCVPSCNEKALADSPVRAVPRNPFPSGIHVEQGSPLIDLYCCADEHCWHLPLLRGCIAGAATCTLQKQTTVAWGTAGNPTTKQQLVSCKDCLSPVNEEIQHHRLCQWFLTFPAELFAAGQVGKLAVPESTASHGGFAPLLR